MKHKGGEKNHIATDHGPMVQGRLLTAHPRGVHGDGGAPRGESFLRQGAGTTSPGSPDFETAVAAEHRRDWKKGFWCRGFPDGGKYRWKGEARGPPGAQAPPGHGPTPGSATRAPGALVGPLWPPLGDSRSFRNTNFLSDF